MENFEMVASMIGEPVRARMLWCLLDGRAYTATELSVYADVSAQNASMHLSKLVRAGLLSVEKQGRHKYYRFAKPDVAYVIESIANLASSGKKEVNSGLPSEGIRFCRTCYDHLAGRVAVDMTRQLLNKKFIAVQDNGYVVTAKGKKWFHELGIDVEGLKNTKRVFARQCLDWSERRHHLAGALGAALLQAMFQKKWIKRIKDSRMTVPTNEGRLALHQRLGLLI